MLDGGIRILEEKHMIAILIALLDNDGCSKTDMYRLVSNNPRMPDKFDKLESVGLIRQESSVDSRSVRLVLTDIGHRVADRLVEIDSLVSDDQ